MQALQKLSLSAAASKCSVHSLKTLSPTGCICQISLRQYAKDVKTGKDETNWVTDGVRATVGEISKKAKEALGYQKKPGNESQEPAGVMENRDPNESQQPQSRYDSLAGKAKEQWADKKVTDLYQDANKNANATAESAKSKAKDNAKAKSSA